MCELGGADAPPVCRRRGFTLIELMIGMAIIGILASLGYPTFKRYKFQTQFAEAHTHLGTMFVGLKAYYQEEHYQQGTVSAIALPNQYNRLNGSGCVPRAAMTSNTPSSQKTVLDWDNEPPTFRAIGFTPPEPLLYNYGLAPSVFPDQPNSWCFGQIGCQGWWANGWCGHNPGNDRGALHLVASGNPQDSPTMYTYVWRLCSNADNVLFACGKFIAPEVTNWCGVARGVGASDGSTGALWVALLVCAVTLRRRRRRVND